jgi:hypothetical protein
VAQAVARDSLYVIQTTAAEFRAEITQPDRTTPTGCAGNKLKLSIYLSAHLTTAIGTCTSRDGIPQHSRSLLLVVPPFSHQPTSSPDFSQCCHLVLLRCIIP